MKTTVAVIGLALLVSACGGQRGAMPAAEIASMSDSQISVVYYDSVSGMGDASKIAGQHCDPLGASPTGSTDATGAPVYVDRTVVSFQCRPVEAKK